MKNPISFVIAIISIMMMPVSSCKKEPSINNDDLWNAVPGGRITTNFSAWTTGTTYTLDLNNDSFQTYGLVITGPDKSWNNGNYVLEFTVSGFDRRSGFYYYIEGVGELSPAEFEAAKKQTWFPLNKARGMMNINNEKTTMFYYRYINNYDYGFPGEIYISKMGKIGDPVQIQFRFYTNLSGKATEMSGNILTRFMPYAV